MNSLAYFNYIHASHPLIYINSNNAEVGGDLKLSFQILWLSVENYLFIINSRYFLDPVAISSLA